MDATIKRGGGYAKQRRNKLLFYISLVGLPSLQFVIFYIIVNFNSIALAFQSYDSDNAVYFFYGFENIKQVFVNFSTQSFLPAAVKNSLICYSFTLLVGIPLAIIFSYYIYKKSFFSGGFKVFLFMPQIVSALVFALIFRFFTDNAIPQFVEMFTGEEADGLLSLPETRFGTVLFYTLWAGFGTQVLMYSGTMSGISDSVIEAGQLDGINSFQELIYIVVPMIFPTITTFIVVGFSGIFINQMNLYAFFGTKAEYADYTLGYYMYSAATEAGPAELPYLSAFGLVMTLFAAPLTLGLRWALNKLGEKF
ncbi:MAG: sugar ABC transporter permease [Clostridia bacterium]|nr:sugar ABC transporter permease [Clostridia bacterium]